MFKLHRRTFDQAINLPHMRSLTFAVLPTRRQGDAPCAAEANVPGVYRVCVPEDLPQGLTAFSAMTSFYMDVAISDPERYDFIYRDDRTRKVFILDEENPMPSDLVLAYMLSETSMVTKVADLPD